MVWVKKNSFVGPKFLQSAEHRCKVTEYWVSVRYRVFRVGSWGWWRWADRRQQVRSSRMRCPYPCRTTRRVRIRALPRIGTPPTPPSHCPRQSLRNISNRQNSRWDCVGSRSISLKMALWNQSRIGKVGGTRAIARCCNVMPVLHCK